MTITEKIYRKMLVDKFYQLNGWTRHERAIHMQLMEKGSAHVKAYTRKIRGKHTIARAAAILSTGTLKHLYK